MTSINVLRLSHSSGLLVCDEARYWNPDWMIFYTPEKIRSIVRDDIRAEQKLALFMGQTGTSSIGDEWIAEIRREIGLRYDDLKKQTGEIPDRFMSLHEIADLAFQMISKIKHEHVNDFIKGKYGITQYDLIAGRYEGSSGPIEIKDKDLLKNASKYMNFELSSEEVKGIFGNSQILGGYSPSEGFRIFYMTERWPICEEVQEIFLAQGSGRDSCDLVYSRFTDNQRLITRKSRASIPRAEGLAVLLEGLNLAFNSTAGVGGYPKIIYVNGDAAESKDWVLEISDHRSKLASEMVAASTAGFIKRPILLILLENLIFMNKPFGEVNREFFQSADDMSGLFRFLRQYPND